MADYDRSLIAKTRTVFNRLFREVDLGYSVGVSEETITAGGRQRIVKLLNVGRIGLYALTLDRSEAFVWDAASSSFNPAEAAVYQIDKAIYMAEGTRIIELCRLPVPGADSGGDRGGGRDGD